MAIEFFYFDLGMVLLTFSVERMCRQMADVAGLDPQRVRQIVFERELQRRYETGAVSDQEFYEAFCQASGTRPGCAELSRAGSDIFELNLSMVPVIAQLQAAGYRTGVLSNTCPGHFEFCRRRYRLLQGGFEVYALSYELQAAKPEREIFLHAARLAGVTPEQIFFTDDIAGHVAGARAAGFDAVQYTSTPELVAELRRRGLTFNF